MKGWFSVRSRKKGATDFPLFFAPQFFPQPKRFQPFTTLHPSPLVTITIFLIYIKIRHKECKKKELGYLM